MYLLCSNRNHAAECVKPTTPFRHQITVYSLDSKTLATLELWYIWFLPDLSVLKSGVRWVLGALPKQTINQFEPVQQSIQQGLRSYCPNIYSVVSSEWRKDVLFISGKVPVIKSCDGLFFCTGYSFWDRLRNFLHKFTWIVLSVHKLNKLGKFW